MFHDLWHHSCRGGSGIYNLYYPAPVTHAFARVIYCWFPPTNTVGDPGAQGAAVTGTQGIGVKTPNAAAVAAATCGFAMEVHIPKGMILTIG